MGVMCIKSSIIGFFNLLLLGKLFDVLIKWPNRHFNKDKENNKRQLKGSRNRWITLQLPEVGVLQGLNGFF
jgi:hypothetical protein